MYVVADGSMNGNDIDVYRVIGYQHRAPLGGVCGLLQIEVLQHILFQWINEAILLKLSVAERRCFVYYLNR